MHRSARRRCWPAVALVAVLTGCASTTAASQPAARSSPTASAQSSQPASPRPSRPQSPKASPQHRLKVMVIAEENHTYDEVFGQNRAPYLTSLAATYATITSMDAGYLPACPSLPAYLLMTSGSTHGVCDDEGPDVHPVTAPSIFGQAESAGLQWRVYAESMPDPCTRHDAAGGRYLVRHAPAPYYADAASHCPAWDLPMGTPDAGAFHDDVVTGRLPAYAFVTPDACDDMHGAAGCRGDLVGAADGWLSRWLPEILQAPDYRAGRLVVVLTWDEGSTSSNHIPTVVVTPAARGLRVSAPTTHCGLLAMEEQILGLPPLGCARTAPSPAATIGLAS